MRTSTVLIRIRFPNELIERVDELATKLRRKLQRRVPRAALVRALVQIQIRAAADDRQEVRDALGIDSVKRGRARVRAQARRPTRRTPP